MYGLVSALASVVLARLGYFELLNAKKRIKMKKFNSFGFLLTSMFPKNSFLLILSIRYDGLLSLAWGADFTNNQIGFRTVHRYIFPCLLAQTVLDKDS